MKRLRFLLGICLVSFISCNIEAPLDDVLDEANSEPASYVHFAKNGGKISLNSVFENLNSVDTVFSESLEIVNIDLENQVFSVIMKDSTRMLHDMTISKNGKKISLIVAFDTTVIHQARLKPYIVSKGYLNSRLLFGFNEKPQQFYALWQNVILPDGFLHFSSTGFSVLIPKEARKQKMSYIRIFGVNDNEFTLDLRVSLIYGIPVLANGLVD